MLQIPLTEIRPGRYQPRRQFDPGRLLELATSIRTDGLLDPPIVWLNEQNLYELIGGERRWRAHIALALANSPAVDGLEAAIDVAANGDILGTVKRLGEYLRAYTMPVSLREAPDDAQRRLALVHNVQRDDLTPIEEARALGELRTAEKLSIRKLAEMVGKSKSWVEDRLRLLELSPELAGQVGQEGGLDLSVMREIGRRIPELAQPALAEALTRKAERGATSQELVKLVGEIGRWADVERWIPADDAILLPGQYNRLRAIRTALVELPPVKLAGAALKLAGEGTSFNSRDTYLSTSPAKAAESSWITDKILTALGTSYDQVVEGRGWTCEHCHLAPLKDKLGERFEGGTYGLPCNRLRYDPDADRCGDYIGADQPVVIEVSSAIASLVPEESPARSASLKRAENFFYTESWQEYVTLYHEAREASAARLRERAEEKKLAHLEPMLEYWQAQQGETVFSLDHFQAHACRKCEHFVQGRPSHAHPCAWADSPKVKGGESQAPDFAVMVAGDGTVVPRCSEFRYGEMPAIQRPLEGGFAIPDRALILRWLSGLVGHNTNSGRGLYGPLAWLPQGWRAGKARQRLDLAELWDRIGDDDVMVVLLDIAVREVASASWGNEVVLRDNLGQVTEWRTIGWRNWQARDLPYGWPDKWPKPWRKE